MQHQKSMTPELVKFRQAAIDTLAQQDSNFVEYYRRPRPLKPEHTDIFETLHKGFLAKSHESLIIKNAEKKITSIAPICVLTPEAIKQYYGGKDSRLDRLKRWVNKKVG